MKVQPAKPRLTAIGGTIGGVKWRYDPELHAAGMEVSPEVGRVLLKSGHWTEVQPKAKRTFKPTVTQVLERPEKFEAVKDDSLSE